MSWKINGGRLGKKGRGKGWGREGRGGEEEEGRKEFKGQGIQIQEAIKTKMSDWKDFLGIFLSLLSIYFLMVALNVFSFPLVLQQLFVTKVRLFWAGAGLLIVCYILFSIEPLRAIFSRRRR